MLFQTLGSNFSFIQTFGHLFAMGGKKDQEKLKEHLENRFKGKVKLYYKGRDALSAGIELSTGGKAGVAINGFTCYSVEDAVKSAGCQPVYVDINRTDLHFSIKELEKSYRENPSVKAIVIQNTFGLPCDIGPIEAFAKTNDMVLIEDLAHSVGATYSDGREVGTVGDIVMLSFGRDKVIDTVNGGVLIIRNPKLQQAIFIRSRDKNPRAIDQLRDRLYPILTWKIRAMHGIYIGKVLQRILYKCRLLVRSADGGIHKDIGLPGWYCKLALQELHALDKNVMARHTVAEAYKSVCPNTVLPLANQRPGRASYVRFPVFSKNRQTLLTALKAQHIYLSDIWYDTPISPKRFMCRSNYVSGNCLVAEEITKSIINLPTHKNVRQSDIQKITAIIREYENV